MTAADPIVPDSERRGLIALLPAGARPFALLARFDRPIGAWLLFWPGAWGIALAGGPAARLWLLGWFAAGAIVMRGAGCVYNDIVDRDLDARVARTRARPLASGAVSARAAGAWAGTLCLLGLIVLLHLNSIAQAVALASIIPVAAYPYMKRITWWPQAWLGIVFAWGTLVGWPAAAGGFMAAGLWLYAGSICWVIGYDTIYAVQDIEDDALAGIRSSARALGRHVRGGVAACYALALGGWGCALWAARPQPLVLAALLPAALHLARQVALLDPSDGARALRLFRSNRDCGLLLFLGFLAVGSAG